MFKIEVNYKEKMIRYYYNNELVDYNDIEDFDNEEVEECIRDFINIEIEYKLNVDNYELNIEVIK